MSGMPIYELHGESRTVDATSRWRAQLQHVRIRRGDTLTTSRLPKRIPVIQIDFAWCAMVLVADAIPLPAHRESIQRHAKGVAVDIHASRDALFQDLIADPR